MAGRIKLIAIDLDGTMVNDAKDLPQANLDAIDEAGRVGITVAVATGRTVTTVPPELLDRPCLRYVISANGSVITDIKENKVLYSNLIPHETGLKVLEAGGRFRCVREFAANGVLFCTADEEDYECSFVSPELKGFMQAMHRTVPSLMEHFHTLNCDCEKLLIFSDLPEALQDLKRYCEEEFGLTVSDSLAENIEITAPGVSKARGLETLAGLLSIPLSETMAIGDSGNDLDMLKAAGFSVAMGNADERVKAAADTITLPNNEAGVAAAIRKYALGQ